jgi:hypothetical protein
VGVVYVLTISIYLPRKQATLENEEGATSGFENFEHVTPEFEKMGVGKLRLSNDRGSVLELEVKVADEPDERAAGFQYINKRYRKEPHHVRLPPRDACPFPHAER